MMSKKHFLDSLNINRAMAFDNPQKARRGSPAGIYFNISGLKYFEVSFLDKKHDLCRQEGREDISSILFFPTPVESDFEYVAPRENWFILLDGIPWEWGEFGRSVKIDTENGVLEISAVIDIEKKDVQTWKARLKQLREDCLNPSPAGCLRQKAMVLSVLEYAINKEQKKHVRTAADYYKKLIDEDDQCLHSLKEIASQCHVSTNCLRMQFKKQFNITPIQYRLNLRMSKAMDLILYTDYSVKEIAEQCSFEYFSHFCQVFKKYYKISPGELIKKERFSEKCDEYLT